MSMMFLCLMLATLIMALMSGYPVAFILGGVSLIAACIGSLLGMFDLQYIQAFPNRVYGIMTNDLLVAIPLFIFMGVMLERAKIAEELLETMSELFGNLRSGLSLSVMIVGALLAASTGIVGATVVTMGLISLPTMMKYGQDKRLSTGIICAAGTLGQIIPPSIVLILLGDQISSAHQAAQLSMGSSAPDPMSIADLFVGAIIPSFMLVGAYIVLLLLYGKFLPHTMPTIRGKHYKVSFINVLKVLFPPLFLIIIVLGSIITGTATATESAAVGAMGAMLLAASNRQFSLENLKYCMRSSLRATCMIFTILIGAALFTLVFRGFSGDDYVHMVLTNLPGGLFMSMALVMVCMFLLGFFLDFIEIIFIVVPIVAPVLLMMGADPIWLSVMIAMNLQTSFLTPPFGFALFYLRGVAPKEIETNDIYKGIIPFVILQILALGLIAYQPKIATFLPELFYGKSDHDVHIKSKDDNDNSIEMFDFGDIDISF